MSATTYARAATADERIANAIKLAKVLAIAENRRRLAKIYAALAELEKDLLDGRERKRAYQGHSREERALLLTAEIWGELDALDIVGGRS